jgi:hypothetical protein
VNSCSVKWCAALAREGSEYCAVHERNPVYRQLGRDEAKSAYKQLRHEQRVNAKREDIAEWNRQAAEKIKERLRGED